MSAQAVGQLSANPPPSRPLPSPAAPGSSVAFGQQLQVARQQNQAALAPAPAPQARPSHTPESGNDQHRDPSQPAAHTRQPQRDDRQVDRSDRGADGKTASAATSSSTAETSTPLAATVAPLVAEATDQAGADEKSAADKPADDDGQDAAALVGAMLALINPAAGKVLASGVAGQSTSSDNSAAVDAAAGAMTANGAPVLTAAQLLAANGLLAETKAAHGPAAGDATPTAALSAPVGTAPTTPVSVSLPTPAGSQTFAQDLGQQISWFVGQNVSQARIRLHPEELGSLDLKINLSHGRVDVVVQAQHPGAVLAVQQSLPQLDQMLAQQGLSLGHAEVGQQDRGHQQGSSRPDLSGSDVDEVHGPSQVTPLAQLGLVDAFA